MAGEKANAEDDITPPDSPRRMLCRPRRYANEHPVSQSVTTGTKGHEHQCRLAPPPCTGARPHAHQSHCQTRPQACKHNHVHSRNKHTRITLAHTPLLAKIGFILSWMFVKDIYTHGSICTVHAHTHTRAHTLSQTRIHKHIFRHAYKRAHTLSQTHTHIHTRAHTHTQGSQAASSVVVKLLDLDPQGRWFDPWCGHDKICGAVGPLRPLTPHCSRRYVSCLV